MRTAAPWLLVLSVALVPRLLFLDADPPMGLGTAWLTDEGWWAHNARQKALFNQWIMDEQNLALYATPAYTIALAGVYKLLGVGFFQTRLVSALAGALTCILLYGFLRRRHQRVALTASLLLGSSYTMLAHNRIGLTESFQLLFLTIAAMAVIRSSDQPRWGALAGVSLVVALLAKTSSIIMLIVIPLYWLVQLVLSRRGKVAFSWAPVVWCVGTVMVAGGIVVAVFVVPYREYVVGYLLSPIRSASGALQTATIRPFGLPGGFALNQFYLASAVLLLLVALFGIKRLVQRRESPLHPAELFAWIWLAVTFGCLSAVSYQPYRRFLLVMPALALLAGFALGEPSFRLPTRADWTGRPVLLRMLAFAVLGGALGYYVTVLGTPGLGWLTVKLGIGGGDGVTQSLLHAAAWHLVFAAVLLGGLSLYRRLPERSIAIPTWAIVLAFILSEPARFATYLVQPTFTVREASRELGNYARKHEVGKGAILGNTADTFALETELFAFTIRTWKERNSYMNLNGWELFKPAFVIELRKSKAFPLELVDQRQPYLKRVRTFHLGHHAKERRQFGQVAVYQVTDPAAGGRRDSFPLPRND